MTEQEEKNTQLQQNEETDHLYDLLNAVQESMSYDMLCQHIKYEE